MNKITSIKNQYGDRVYRIVDAGCIQEFWTYKEAKEYVEYIQQGYIIAEEYSKQISKNMEDRE